MPIPRFPAEQFDISLLAPLQEDETHFLMRNRWEVDEIAFRSVAVSLFLAWVKARSRGIIRRHAGCFLYSGKSGGKPTAPAAAMAAPQRGVDAYGFIYDHIESVPHLEALVLLWNSRPVGWTCEELSSRLYISPHQVAHLLRDLVRMELIAESATSPRRFSYLPKSDEQNELLASIDHAHRKDLVRISRMIHSKTSSGMREFARAFQFKREKK